MAKESEIKAIFFDFGDVLVFYDHMRGCEALSVYSAKKPSEIYALVFGSHLEEMRYNRGEYTDVEWYDICVDLLDLCNCPYSIFAEKWGDIFSPNLHIQSVLSKIRPGVQKFVLSNTNGLHWAWAQKNLSVLKENFPTPHNAILSSEEKSRKPERLIYERALERAGVRTHPPSFLI